MLIIRLGNVDYNLEAKIVVQALRINTLSKLTFSDSIRFDALLKDIFPGVEFKDIEYEELRKALEEVCKEHHLGVIDTQVGSTAFISRLALRNVNHRTFVSSS